ncbi:ubiquinol-cytochrome c reductase iron-sulfur subunit [Acidocella sp.]|uniref:ubiquinol-cytochrome c reductase iron-sulfur subunit n=1 Tax=Acidocella sp. TaxID=50710 RepID=UPI00261CF04B|nr:ubiquinol-cytochrome c reductase iron-sulfur subunit [Acidocella sp.]
MVDHTADANSVPVGESRRGFLAILAMAGGAVGAATILWPVIDALNPDAGSEAAARPVVTVSDIPENTARQVMWGGLPILIRRLTDKQLADNETVSMDDLPDPASLESRVAPANRHFVVVVGLNTATPCALEGNTPSEPRGDFDGWLCACDGSQYDPLGRARRGPSRRNLPIPRFTFINEAQIQLG